MTKGFMECPFCKNEIREGAKKCQFCGELLEKKDDGPFEVKKYTKAKRYLIFLFIISLITIPVYIGFIFLIITIIACTRKLELHKDHVLIKHGLIVIKKENIPYNKINSVDTTNTLGMVDLNIFVGNDKPMKFTMIEKSDEVVDRIRECIKK